MGIRLQVLGLVMMGAVSASAQVLASHAPTATARVSRPPVAQSHAPAAAQAAAAQAGALANKPVAKVNGAVLSELDLKREMYSIFPYAKVHDGFPKDLEPEIRKGALEMIIFEELLYQEGKRRNLAVSAQKLNSAEAAFRKQFPSQYEYEEYMKGEMKGDKAVLREKIRRSLLIEQMLKTEVKAKSVVTPQEVRAFYDKNPKNFEHGESFHIQTISVMPPDARPENKAEARKRADEAFKLAKAAKSYREFGLIAEKFSDDDWHVNMGDRKETEVSKLPSEVIKTALAMKPGDVSNVIQLGDCYTIFRLVSHTPAGKQSFAEVKAKLQKDMEREKTQIVRAELGQRLRKNAKLEIL